MSGSVQAAAGIGHNSLSIRNVIERLANLKEAGKEIAADRRQLMNDAETAGFDKKAVREAFKIWEMEEVDRKEFEANRSTYLEALDLI